MSNDRCETLDIILASLLKHCFQVMHIVYSLILYEQVELAQFLWPKEHSTNISTQVQRTISSDSFYTSHFHLFQA